MRKKQKIHELLNDLQIQLKEAHSIDKEEKEHLKRVMNAIQELIDTESEDQGHRHSLTENLSEIIQRFEGSHPNLTQTVGQVIEKLNEMGI